MVLFLLLFSNEYFSDDQLNFADRQLPVGNGTRTLAQGDRAALVGESGREDLRAVGLSAGDCGSSVPGAAAGRARSGHQGRGERAPKNGGR